MKNKEELNITFQNFDKVIYDHEIELAAKKIVEESVRYIPDTIKALAIVSAFNPYISTKTNLIYQTAANSIGLGYEFPKLLTTVLSVFLINLIHKEFVEYKIQQISADDIELIKSNIYGTNLFEYNYNQNSDVESLSERIDKIQKQAKADIKEAYPIHKNEKFYKELLNIETKVITADRELIPNILSGYGYFVKEVKNAAVDAAIDASANDRNLYLTKLAITAVTSFFSQYLVDSGFILYDIVTDVIEGIKNNVHNDYIEVSEYWSSNNHDLDVIGVI